MTRCIVCALDQVAGRREAEGSKETDVEELPIVLGHLYNYWKGLDCTFIRRPFLHGCFVLEKIPLSTHGRTGRPAGRLGTRHWSRRIVHAARSSPTFLAPRELCNPEIFSLFV